MEDNHETFLHFKKLFFKTVLNTHLFFLITKNIKQMKNWKTTLFGICAAVFSALSVEFPEQKEIFVSLAALAGSLFAYFAKDSNVSGTAKTVALFLFLSLGNFLQAQTTNYDFTGYPSAGTSGSIQVNGFGGLTSADSLFLKNDTALIVVSTKTPTQILQQIGITSFQQIIQGGNGYIISQGDTDRNGASIYSYYDNSFLLNGMIKGATSTYGIEVKPTSFNYLDTTGTNYNLLNSYNKPFAYTKTNGKLNNNYAVYYGYGNGSVSGIDTVYLTDNGLQSGNDLFRTVNTNEVVITANSVNDTMLITKVVSFQTSNAPKYITVRMKYLTSSGAGGSFSDVPDGIKVKAIVTGELN